MWTFIIGLFVGSFVMGLVMACFSVNSYNKGYKDGKLKGVANIVSFEAHVKAHKDAQKRGN